MLEINTEGLRECGKDITSLSNDYSEKINKIFSRIDGMSSLTGEWRGEAATKFICVANMDNPQYRNFGKIISSYGNYLNKVANRIETLCIEVKRK